MMEFKCIKTLYMRSTTTGRLYGAFRKGHWYAAKETNRALRIMAQIGGHNVTPGSTVAFSLTRNSFYPLFETYFDVTSERVKDEKIIDAKLKNFIEEHS